MHLTGALEFRDDVGRTIGIESAETLHGRYLAHCALHGIEPGDVVRVAAARAGTRRFAGRLLPRGTGAGTLPSPSFEAQAT